MSDYPDYFPPFMRDFHDQKDLVKAFYTWLHISDSCLNKERGTDIDRPSTCSWIDFHILFTSMIDFLWRNGWQITRTRRRVEHADIQASIRNLRELDMALGSLLMEEHPLRLKDEQILRILEDWKEWLPYLPKEAQEFVKDKKGSET
jgi:hypothetical protein